MNEQNTLDKWKEEYINECIYESLDIIYMGFKELGGSVVDGYRMGVCKTLKTTDKSWCDCRIFLDNGCVTMPKYFHDSVLWHEFCHAWCQAEIYDNQGHRKEFKIRRRKKPLYWIGDMLLKWIGGIWVR